IQGTNAVGAMIVAGPEGFRKNQYRKFNIKSADLTPGDDYGMMREVLTRRFKRLLSEAPRADADTLREDVVNTDAPQPTTLGLETREVSTQGEESPWPDLVLIDGGEGQLKAVEEMLRGLGVTDVPLLAIAKGPDRDAGRETFHVPAKPPFKLLPRDPVLYF